MHNRQETWEEFLNGKPWFVRKLESLSGNFSIVSVVKINETTTFNKSDFLNFIVELRVNDLLKWLVQCAKRTERKITTNKIDFIA